MSRLAQDWASSRTTAIVDGVERRLSSDAKHLLGRMGYHANAAHGWECWACKDTLQTATNLRRSTLYAAQAELVRGGLIERVGWRGRMASYRLNIPDEYIDAWEEAEEARRDGTCPRPGQSSPQPGRSNPAAGQSSPAAGHRSLSKQTKPKPTSRPVAEPVEPAQAAPPPTPAPEPPTAQTPEPPPSQFARAQALFGRGMQPSLIRVLMRQQGAAETIVAAFSRWAEDQAQHPTAGHAELLRREVDGRAAVAGTAAPGP